MNAEMTLVLDNLHRAADDAVCPDAAFKASLRSRLVAAASLTARSAAGVQTERTTSPTKEKS